MIFSARIRGRRIAADIGRTSPDTARARQQRRAGRASSPRLTVAWIGPLTMAVIRYPERRP